jgi:methionine synthase II (cobalamin-independent)
MLVLALRHVPDDRIVVLGLVSSKKPRRETPDELKARIGDASRIVPLERLALSPQCGFASTSERQSFVHGGSTPKTRRRRPDRARSVAGLRKESSRWFQR